MYNVINKDVVKARMIEIMALVNLPVCNLNRDESGQPKECHMGGFDRNRLSSQSLKYAMRYSDAFKGLNKHIENSVRTAKMYEYVYDFIGRENLKEDMQVAIKKLCSTLGIALVKSGKCPVKYDSDTDTYIFPDKIKKVKINDTEDEIAEEEEVSDSSTDKDRKGMTLVYSKEQCRFICETIKKMVDACEGDVSRFSLFKNTNIFERNGGKDISSLALDTALFGSMSASDAIRSIPAAVQVAHAFSTNAITRESDFFIAADDFVRENPDKAQGAGNMGYVDFTCPCIYKYAKIDLDILRNNLSTVDNLDDVVFDILTHFITEFATVLPSGKQNSNAAYSKPSMICVTVKDKKVPCNYANAFETPISATLTESLSEKSISALVKEIDTVDKFYDIEILERGWMNCKNAKAPVNSTVCESLKGLVEMTKKYI